MGKKGNKLRKRNRKRKEAREKNKTFSYAEYIKAYKGGNKDAYI